jgi:hypothetical protein
MRKRQLAISLEDGEAVIVKLEDGKKRMASSE